MTPRDMAAIRDGARLQGILPMVEQHMDEQMAQLDGRAFRLLDEGQLTPETALAFWIERRTYARLTRKMVQRVRIGQAAGERVGSEMDLPLPGQAPQ